MAEILYFPRKTIYGTPEEKLKTDVRMRSSALIIPFPGVSHNTDSKSGDANHHRGPCWTLDSRTKDNRNKTR